MVQYVCDVDDVQRRVRGEYCEMPGLRLTLVQAQRLWGLDALAAQSVIRALVDARFLRPATDGTFVRVDANSPRW